MRKAAKAKPAPSKTKAVATPKKRRPRDEQGVLIDTLPENSKQIVKVAKEYRAALRERVAALATEKDRKATLLALVKAAHLTPLEDGTIKFPIDGLTITIKPRDELVRVRDTDDEDADDSDSGDDDSEDD